MSSLKLSDIVTLSGIPGLHKIVKADAKNVIIEALDESKKRQIVKGNMMVSKLSDIGIYTDDGESVALNEVMKNIQAKYEGALPVQPKSSNAELLDFLASVLPNFDREKVYASNVKKLVQWYEILSKVEVSYELESEDTENQTEEVAVETAE